MIPTWVSEGGGDTHEHEHRVGGGHHLEPANVTPIIITFVPPVDVVMNVTPSSR